jgi:hypothetical protein
MKLFPGLFSAAAGFGLCVAPSARAALYTVTTTADSGPGSLRNAIAAAGSGDTIVFSSSLAGQTIQLTSGQLSIGQNLTIDASALANGVIINGGGNGLVLEIGGGTMVNLNLLTLTNGYPKGGLSVDPNATLTANNCTFLGNSAGNGSGSFGGGVYADLATVRLNGCIFIGNSLTNGGGGGIYQNGGAVTLNGCTFSGNSAADGEGGAIETSSGTFVATNCIFQNNSSSLGGAFENAANTATLVNCAFSNNVAGVGGGIGNITILTLNNCNLSDNASLSGQGGGLANGGGAASTETATLNNCILTGNSATAGEGGGIYNYAELVLTNCTLSGNTATNGGSGGGIINLDMLIANNCALSANSADGGYGGGIVNGYQMTLNNCTLFGNSADDGFGGGLYTLSATSVLNNCTVCSNSAITGGYGGGICNIDSTLALTNTIAAGNAADNSPDVYGTYTGLANFVGGNPALAPLGSYGGPTATMPPIFGSPVIDAGADWVTNFLSTDQRGFPRLAGAHVDIGAVEAQTAPANNPPILRNPVYSPPGGILMPARFRFMFTNVANIDFTVIASTNLALPLAQWTVLGNAQPGLPPVNGYYQFQEIVPTGFGVGTNNSVTILVPDQFYRVVSP